MAGACAGKRDKASVLVSVQEHSSSGDKHRGSDPHGIHLVSVFTTSERCPLEAEPDLRPDEDGSLSGVKFGIKSIPLSQDAQ